MMTDQEIDRRTLQAKIRQDYPQQLEEARVRLCGCCKDFKYGACTAGLLPITSKGEPCPYHQAKE